MVHHGSSWAWVSKNYAAPPGFCSTNRQQNIAMPVVFTHVVLLAWPQPHLESPPLGLNHKNLSMCGAFGFPLHRPPLAFLDASRVPSSYCVSCNLGQVDVDITGLNHTLKAHALASTTKT